MKNWKTSILALALIPYMAGSGYVQTTDYLKEKALMEQFEQQQDLAQPQMEGMIGEVRMFAGNFAPRGWAFCHGQLLAINSNTALFSILGTTYGGDGRTTFALPDLRGRVAVGPGNGPGLGNVRLGSKFGTEGLAEVSTGGGTSPIMELAQGKAARQSSNYTASSGLASKAVDGNNSGVWTQNSVTHTAGGGTQNPWWEVDLGGNYEISRVEIYNRSDCCAERLTHFNILVDGQKFLSSDQVYSRGQANPQSYSGNKTGRKVRIQMNGKGILSLAEVKVYGRSLSGGGGKVSVKRGSHQPSLGMNYIICTVGIFPSRN